MTSSPVLQENAKNKPQNRGAGPRGISVLFGVLWLVGAARGVDSPVGPVA